MKPKTISYSHSRETVSPIGLKQWNKIGIEVEVEEGEDPTKAFQSAKEMVDDFHKSLQTGFPVKEELQWVLPVTHVEKSKENRIEQLIADINSCTEVKVLESYKILARTNPTLQEAYDKRLKELL